MLTLFAIPKAFRGHTAVIQRNAIGSWARLGKGSCVILLGDEEGTAEVARDFHLKHLPEIARNEFGTPLVSDLFGRAHAWTAHDDVLCYVNSDVILLSDFLPAVERVRERTRRFLVVGECWNLDLRTPVPFDDPAWQEQIARSVSESGVRRGSWYIDYFAFSYGLYREVPPFAVGRAGFDNWLVWKARALGAAVVDASRVVTAIHQNHDYAHVGGREWAYRGPEAARNVRLAGGTGHLYRLDDASHVLTARRLRRRPGAWARLGYRQAKLRDRFHGIFWRAAEATRPVRHRFGVRAATFRRLWPR
jgi:hypothetical protein